METEAEKGYWKRMETVDVVLITEREGWFLQKYKVESDVSIILFSRTLAQLKSGCRRGRAVRFLGGIRTLFGFWNVLSSDT